MRIVRDSDSDSDNFYSKQLQIFDYMLQYLKPKRTIILIPVKS